MRSMFGFVGQSLISNALASNASNKTAEAILSRISELKPALDIDRNGLLDGLTDGLLILRYMFGFRGDSLIANAVGENATRNTAPLIEDYLEGFFTRGNPSVSAMSAPLQEDTNIIDLVGVSNTPTSTGLYI